MTNKTQIMTNNERTGREIQSMDMLTTYRLAIVRARTQQLEAEAASARLATLAGPVRPRLATVRAWLSAPVNPGAAGAPARDAYRTVATGRSSVRDSAGSRAA